LQHFEGAERKHIEEDSHLSNFSNESMISAAGKDVFDQARRLKSAKRQAISTISPF
jgi:hypothetical protein